MNISFQRDEYTIRIHTKKDTERVVIEIGSKQGSVRVGHLRADRAYQFSDMLEYFVNGSDVIVIEENDQ